jgi:hypothetical protein
MRRASFCIATALALVSAAAPAAASVNVHTTRVVRAVRPLPIQTLEVPRRAVVTFTVKEKEPPAPGFPYLPKGVGDYFAVYFPAIKQGWVNLRDPGSRTGWSAQFPLFGSARFPSLLPHHRYRMLVAVQRPGRIMLPLPMHVVRMRPSHFRVAALTHVIPQLTPSSTATIGTARDSLANLPIESTGIVLDWAADASLTESVQGDACPTALPVGGLLCPKGNVGTFVITQTGFGRRTPLQISVGEAFDHAVNASYVSTYAANLPTPFNKATILAFGIDPRWTKPAVSASAWTGRTWPAPRPRPHRRGSRWPPRQG